MGYLYHVYDVIGDIIKEESAVRTRPRMFYLGAMDGIKGRSTAKDFLSSFLLLFGLSEKQLQCLTTFNILSWSVNFFHLLCDLPWTKPPIDFVYSSRTPFASLYLEPLWDITATLRTLSSSLTATLSSPFVTIAAEYLVGIQRYTDKLTFFSL